MTARPFLPMLGLLASLALVGCGDAEADNSPPATRVTPAALAGAKATRVETATIELSSARLVLSLPGEVTGSRDARLASATGGFVEAVLVDEGDAVAKGQSLVRVNAGLASAQLDQANAQKALAESELGRLEKLGDLASPAQIEGARTQAEVARAAARIAEINASRSVVRAPFAGMVAAVTVEEGEVAGPGALVVRLVQLDPIRVDLSVSDRDITAIRPGMPVSASIESRAGVYQGKVVTVMPAADLNTRSFLAEVELDNPDHALLPGMIASVSLAREVAEGAIVLPQDWLVTRLDGIGVFKAEPVEDGDNLAVARWTPVEAGEVIGNQVVIRAGLASGDQVVTTGHRTLAEGDSLLISRTGVCCTNGRATYE